MPAGYVSVAMEGEEDTPLAGLRRRLLQAEGSALEAQRQLREAEEKVHILSETDPFQWRICFALQGILLDLVLLLLAGGLGFRILLPMLCQGVGCLLGLARSWLVRVWRAWCTSPWNLPVWLAQGLWKQAVLARAILAPPKE